MKNIIHIFSYLIISCNYATLNAQSPGGVSTNVKLWYKADVGVKLGASNATNGQAIDTWENQISTYSLTQSTATRRPIYYNTESNQQINYNPSLRFDGTDDFIGNTSSFMTSTSAYSYFIVEVDSATDGGWRALLSAQSIYRDIFDIYKQGAAGASYNRIIPYGVSGSPDYGSFGKGTTYSSYNGAYWNGSSFTSDATVNKAQAQVIGLRSTNNLTTDPLVTYADGYKDGPNTVPTWSYINENTIYRPYFFQTFFLGADAYSFAAYGEHWQGKIAEVIAYDRNITDAEANKIQSYLGIKYGITLGQGNGYVGRNGNNFNYLNSSGTTIWDGTTNTSYGYDIFGIGRDDNEALNQKQSKSINGGTFQPAISLNNGLATNNVTNANTFAVDNSYLIAGHNGLATTYSNTYTPTTFSSVPCLYIMDRKWKVQESGTVGTVTVTIPIITPLMSSTTYMVVSNSPSFGIGTNEILMTNDGLGNLTAQVDFTSGQYFTFVQLVTAPGGITSGLKAWYKADNGVLAGDGTSVATWTNSASGSSYNVTQATAAYQPKFYNTTASKLLNYNPTLAFDGTDELINATRLYASTDGFELLGIGKDIRTNISGTYNATMGIGLDGNYPALDLQTTAGVSPNGWNPWMTGSSPAEWNGGNAILYNGNVGGINQQPQIYGLGCTNLYTATNYSADNIISNVDGYIETTTLDAYRQSEIGNGIYVGSSGDAEWNGLIPEIIVYNRKLSTTELLKVNSYLAIKYGITLDQRQANDYIASDGTSIYAASTFGAYNNDIAGIGQDICSGLFQPKSTSVNEDAVVTIAATPANIQNKEFLAWANNGLSLNVINNTDVPTLPYDCSGRLDRIWHIQKATGDIGAVTLDFDLRKLPFQSTLNNFKLLIRNGSYAMNGAVVSPIVPTIIGDTIVRFSNVTFNNNDYFTLYGNSITPGGVSNHLVAWYKADNNTSSIVTLGSTVTRWNDNYGYRDLIRYYNTSTPIYQTTAPKLLNYNNSIEFDNDAAVAQFMYNTTTYFPNNSGFHMITVGKDLETALGILRATGGMGNIATGNYPGLDLQTDGSSPNGWNFVMDLSSPTYYYTGGGFPLLYNGNTGGTNQQPQIYSVGSTNASTTATNNIYSYIDGYKWLTDMDAFQQAAIGKQLYVGSSGTDAWWDGLIGEVIIYDGLLSDAEVLKINTYLAIKYGITLNQSQYNDYTASNGTVIYAASTYGAFNHDIAGIGLDSCSGLMQPKSTSVDDDAVVTMEATAGFGKNPSFLVWANNDEDSDGDGIKLEDVLYTGTICVDSILDRDWKVQLTNYDNHTKPVNVTFDRTKLITKGTDFALLIDTTGNTDYNHAYVILPSAVTASIITFNGVTNFTNGAVFTLASDANAYIPKLYPYGSEVVTQKCRNGQWIYLKDPTAEDYYLGAIKDSNFIINLNTLTPKVDVNSAYSDLGDGDGTQAVRLMRRMLELNCNNCYNKTTYSDPSFTVRMFFSPNERQAAKDGSGSGFFSETEYLDVLPPIGGTPELQHWFKVSGLVNNILPVPADGIHAPGQIWAMSQLPTGILNGINYVDYYDIDSFSVFGYAISKSQLDQSPLPIELLSFYGENEGENNMLYWTTASERNSWKFIVEHEDDNNSFSPIGEVLGAGTSNNLNEYQLVHYLPKPGNNYYRLKQVDFDSSYTYSNIILVKNKINQTIQVYPNPADKEIMILFSDQFSSISNIQIIDMLGQVVYDKNWDISISKLANIDVKGLSKATYILKINNVDTNDKLYFKFNKN